MSQLLQEAEALRPQEEDRIVQVEGGETIESPEPLDLSFVDELLREPSSRDRGIHRAVCVEEREPADVAAEFGLAEGTVRNIARRVRRWKGTSEHDLIEMSSLEMLLAYYDQLKWQSRQLKLAWEYSAATREFTDKTFYRRPNDPDRQHERVRTRCVESRGPNERYMRLHDHIREKMLKVGREVKELQAEEAERKMRVVAGPRVVAGSPDPATGCPRSPTAPTLQPASMGARSETAAAACCGQETAAEQGQGQQPVDAFADLKAQLDKAGAEVKKMQENPSPLGRGNLVYTQVGDGQWQVRAAKSKKSKKHFSKHEKQLLRAAKQARKAGRRAGDTTGHSQQGVIASPQAAMAPQVATPQVE